MAKTIQTLRQQLTDISRDLDLKRFDETLNEHDKKNLAYAVNKVEAARQALFDCARCRGRIRCRHESQSMRTATIRITLQCNECGKQWKVSPNSDPQCPKCNGVDYEVRS